MSELELQELDNCHLFELTKLTQDPYLMRWIANGYAWSPHRAEKVIKEYRDNRNPDRCQDNYYYFVLLKQEKVIGLVYFRPMNYGPKKLQRESPFVLSILIAKKEQGKGYAVWALNAALKIFWSFQPQQKVFADVRTYNSKMNALMKKMGIPREKEIMELFEGKFYRYVFTP